MSGDNLAVQAFVVSASEKDAVAVALPITLADDDVAEAVDLCGVHGSFSEVVLSDGLLKHCLIRRHQHDGSKGVFVVIHEQAFGIGERGVCFVSIEQFTHGVFSVVVQERTPLPKGQQAELFSTPSSHKGFLNPSHSLVLGTRS